MDLLNIHDVNTALIGTRFAGRVQHLASVGSTNALLLEQAADGAAEGTVLVADEQTAGRGRGGHSWHSTAGDGLYVSALVKPALPLADALLISLATGLAAQHAAHAATALTLDIRWPNDLLVQSRKCGGILVETAVDNQQLRYAVIGIGINVNHAAFPDDLATLATSLRIAAGQPFRRAPLLIALLRALDREMLALESGDHALLERFTAASTWVRGKRVHVPEQGGYTGLTAGLDGRGFLRVAADDGTTRTVLSGGVREV